VFFRYTTKATNASFSNFLVIAKPVRRLVVAIRSLAAQRAAYIGRHICFANVHWKGLVCIFAKGEN